MKYSLVKLNKRTLRFEEISRWKGREESFKADIVCKGFKNSDCVLMDYYPILIHVSPDFEIPLKKRSFENIVGKKGHEGKKNFKF